MTRGRKLNILIVDDEPLARRRIEALCDRMEIVERINIASDGQEALDSIVKNYPDVVLLDINMPDMSGMVVARQCKNLHLNSGASEAAPPEIIFTTAYSQYAVEAFRVDAANYLLKPVKEDLLREAFERVLQRRDRGEGARKITDNQWLWAQDGQSSVQIRILDIGWITAEGDYMRLCLPERSYLVHDAMQSLLERLPGGMFIRIHRSAAVRRDLLRDIRRKGRRNFIVMDDGTQLTIGPSYLDSVLRESNR
ncbi:response regulator transcription factor [Parasphingorhabdus sp.]|uniref:LytR/AlgR family response regulator transcription factor n=1 Tax=Parasphingorhabdus sp. TaxID=2709688 RepID=UPI002F939AC5